MRAVIRDADVAEQEGHRHLRERRHVRLSEVHPAYTQAIQRGCIIFPSRGWDVYGRVVNFECES